MAQISLCMTETAEKGRTQLLVLRMLITIVECMQDNREVVTRSWLSRGALHLAQGLPGLNPRQLPGFFGQPGRDLVSRGNHVASRSL